MKKTMLEMALDKYYQTFGSNYPLLVVDIRTDEEIIKDIGDCIKSKKKAEEPKYEKGVVY